MKRIIATVLAFFAIAFAGAIPASATPNSTIALWIIDTAGQMYSVNPETGVANAVGASSGIQDTMAAALDPISGRIIVITEACDLYSANTSTGAVNDLSLSVSPNSGPAANYCTSMTIDGEGIGWASVTLADGSDHLASFDLSTGNATVRPTALADYYDAMFFDPTTGRLFGQNDSTGTIFEANLTTGADTNTGTATSPYSYNIVMDNQGNYWANSWDSLYKGTAGQWNSGAIVGGYTATSSVNCLFTSTNFWPAHTTTPTLANTGKDENAYLMFSGLLILGGMAIRQFSPRRKRA